MKLTPKCKHRGGPEFTYMQALDDAEVRLAAGEAQGLCVWCCHYIWSHLFFTRTDFLESADAADEQQSAIRYSERRTKRRGN